MKIIILTMVIDDEMVTVLKIKKKRDNDKKVNYDDEMMAMNI